MIQCFNVLACFSSLKKSFNRRKIILVQQQINMVSSSSAVQRRRALLRTADHFKCTEFTLASAPQRSIVTGKKRWQVRSLKIEKEEEEAVSNDHETAVVAALADNLYNAEVAATAASIYLLHLLLAASLPPPPVTLLQYHPVICVCTGISGRTVAGGHAHTNTHIH